MQHISNKAITTALQLAAGPQSERLTQLHALDAQAWAGLNHDYKKAIRTAREAASLGSRLNVAIGYQRSLVIISTDLSTQARFQECSLMLQQAESMARLAADWLCLVHVMRLRAQIAARQKRTDEARRLYRYCVESCSEHKLRLPALGYTRAILHSHQHRYDSTIRALLRTIPRCETPHDSYVLASCYCMLSTMYRKVNNVRDSMHYAGLSVALNKRIGIDKNVVHSLVNLADGCSLLSRHKEAGEYMEAALRAVETSGMHHSLVYIHANYASILVQAQRIDEALEHAQLAVHLAREHPQSNTLHGALSAMAYTCLSAGRYEQADEYYREALQRASGIDDIHTVWQIYRDLAHIYESRGKPAAALEYYKMYVETFRKLSGSTVQRRIGKFTADHHAVEVRQEARRLGEKVRTLQRRIVDSEQTLHKTTLCEARLREDLRRILEESRRLAGSEPEGETSQIHLLLQRIEDLAGSNSGSRDNATTYPTLQDDFCTRLRSRYNALSPIEAKVCNLVRAGLSSQEIGAQLHLSTHTVNTHRQHIRQKLGLKRSQNLGSFLAAL